MNLRRRLILFTSFFGPHVALAQTQASEVATARQLAISGIDAVEGGDCGKGEPLLERAEQLHHASVHLQYLARCRVSEGRLVAATEMWRQILREGTPPGSSPAVIAASNEATNELARTLPRLAGTTIRNPQTPPGLTLLLDGKPLPIEMIGANLVLDPGDHEIEAQAPGFSRWTKKWTLSEGGGVELVIELEPGAPGSEPSEGGSESASSGERRSSILTPVGFVVGAAGVASLVAGTVTLLTRNNRRDDFYGKCSQQTQQCSSSQGFKSQAEFDSETSSK